MDSHTSPMPVLHVGEVSLCIPDYLEVLITLSDFSCSNAHTVDKFAKRKTGESQTLLVDGVVLQGNSFREHTGS